MHTPDTPIEELVKHEPRVVFLAAAETSNSHKSLFALPIPTKVPEIYKSLIFPSIVQSLPTKLANKLPKFDGENSKSPLKNTFKILRVYLTYLK